MIAESTIFSPTETKWDETAALARSESFDFSESATKTADDSNSGADPAMRRPLEDRQHYLAHIFEAQRRFGE